LFAFIDDVARIVGLYVLQMKIANNLHFINRRLYLDLRISPKVFKQYLAGFSAEGLSKRFNFVAICLIQHFLRG